MPPRRIAEIAGVGEEFVRAACARRKDPLPHVDVGRKGRRHYRIRWEAFEEWYRKEETRDAR